MNINNTSLPQKNTIPALTSDSFRRYAQKIEPLLKKPQNRVYTTTILSFLVVSLFLWYAIRPTMQTIFSLRREIADNIAVSKQMEEKISALVQAQATYQSITTKLPLLSQALPKDPNPVPLLLSLNNLAEITQATISSIQLPRTELVSPQATLSGEEQDRPLASFFITLTVDGTFEQVTSFLNGVIELRRIVSVESISLSPIITEIQEAPLVRLVTKIQAHYLPGGTL